MPIVNIPDSTNMETVQVSFNGNQRTMVEALGEIGNKVNEVINLVNALEGLVDTQSAQIGQFMAAQKNTLDAALAAFEAWKNELAAPTVTALTLANDWAAAAGISCGCFMDAASVVHLRGKLTIGTITGGTVITQLPVGKRPAQAVVLQAPSNALALLDVAANGNVSVKSVDAACTYLSLDGLSFTIL